MKTVAFLLCTSIAFSQSKLGVALQKFWAAGSPSVAAKTTDDLAKTGASFE